MVRTSQIILILLVMLNLANTQITVPFTIESTSKLVPVALTIEKNFVQSDQFQQIFGNFSYYLKAPEGIFYSYWDQNSNQCRYDLKNQKCLDQPRQIIFPADTAMPIFPYILHKVLIHLWIFEKQNPKKGETWKFIASLCEQDTFYNQCNNQITSFSFYLPIM